MDVIDSLDLSHLVVAALAFGLGYVIATMRGSSDPRDERQVRTAADILSRRRPSDRPGMPSEAGVARTDQPDRPGSPYASPSAPVSRNWFVIAFLSFWLVGWTIGIYMAVTEMLPGASLTDIGADDAFIVVWIGAASVGWLFVVRILWKLLKGEPVNLKKSR